MVFETALAGIAGAAVGAYLNQWLPRANPSILVHSIELSTALVDPDETVDKGELVREITEFPRHLSAHLDGPRVKKGIWLDYLSTVQADLEDYRSELEGMDNSIRRLRQLVAEEDFSTAQVEFAHGHHIWHIVESEHLSSGTPVFSNPEELDKDDADSLVDTDSDGDYIVQVEGGLEVMFEWSQEMASKRRAASKLLARRCASALATRNKQCLFELLDYARTAMPELRIKTRQLTESVDEELRKHQHLIVTALLANSGRLEYLVDSKARAVINMKGYPSRSPQAISSDKRISQDVEIDMILEDVSEEAEYAYEMIQAMSEMTQRRRVAADRMKIGRSRSVFVVKGEGPVTVRCVSAKRLNEMECGEDLTAAYSGGEREAYIILSVMKPRRPELTPWYSKKFPFRNIERQADFPIRAF
jgi:hypothetical protein